VLQRFTWLTLILLACAQLANAEAPGLKKIKDIIIYKDASYYSAFPSIVQRQDGELLCAFRRAPDRKALWGAPGYTHTDTNSYLVLVRSRDNGETWTKEPELIFAHPLGGSQDPCMVQLRDGSIVCTSYGWAQVPEQGFEKLKDANHHGAYHFLGGYVLRSDDGGKTWKGPFVPIPIPGNQSIDALGRPVPAFNRGAMCQGKDGRLYWAVAGRDGGSGPTQVHLMISSDRGETWSYSCPIAKDAKVLFNETSLIETKKGDLVAFMRTANIDDHLCYARSTDGGKSFENPRNPPQGRPDSTRLRLQARAVRNSRADTRCRLHERCNGAGVRPTHGRRKRGHRLSLGGPTAGRQGSGHVLLQHRRRHQTHSGHAVGTRLEANT